MFSKLVQPIVFRCGTDNRYLNPVFVKSTLMLCKQKLCKMRWGAKQIYYATYLFIFFLNRRLEAADALELLYCTRDKVERSGVRIPVSLHRGLQPGQLDPGSGLCQISQRADERHAPKRPPTQR